MTVCVVLCVSFSVVCVWVVVLSVFVWCCLCLFGVVCCLPLWLLCGCSFVLLFYVGVFVCVGCILWFGVVCLLLLLVFSRQ